MDAGEIIPDKKYDNFELKLDRKIDTSGKGGIFFYMYEDTAK